MVLYAMLRSPEATRITYWLLFASLELSFLCVLKYSPSVPFTC